MLDTDLIKTLCSHDSYMQCKDKLTASIFSEDVRDLYDALKAGHEKYGHDLATNDLMAIWKIMNPVATKAERNDMAHLLQDIDGATALSADIAIDSVETMWRRDIGKRIATLGLEMSEGQDEAMSRLQSLLESHSEGYMPDDFGEDTTQDLDELLEMIGDEHRFKFNIATLSSKVYGIGPAEFGIVFATPETGKTGFIVSICLGPNGFVDQGKKVLMLGNEEASKRTVVRGYQCVTGLTGEQIQFDPEVAKQIYRAKTEGRIVYKDTQDWDLDKIEAFIAKKRPDVVVIDQLDKVKVAGNFNSGHERLRELYRRIRETAKRYNCALIGVSQASNDATGKTRLEYSMMEGSKIGKAAEADLIIGIGKHNSGDDGEPDNARFLTVSKNKLSGWHGTVICQIQPEISRYVE
jgi:replicative DNA helicase